VTINAAEVNLLTATARRLRHSLLVMLHAAQTGHPGSSLSAIEILTILYFNDLDVDPHDPCRPGRDRFLLSKGHGAPALYVALAHRGFFPVTELASLRRFGSRLQGHPVAGTLPGIEFSTGSLGQGLSVSAGLALALRLRREAGRVICLVGDGEMQEGQNWEAAAAAAKLDLGNLVCIVDRNHLQNDGPTETILPLDRLVERFVAFGWRAHRVDGHDFLALNGALEEGRRPGPPLAIIADTVKGRGVSFMEGVVHWHHHPIDDDHLSRALAEIEEER
jgi:transketolase